MKGGRGYKQWSVNGASFRGSPYNEDRCKQNSTVTHMYFIGLSGRGRGGGVR